MDCRAASTDIFLDYFDEVRIFDLLKQFGASLESHHAGESRNRQLGANSQHHRPAQSQSPIPGCQKSRRCQNGSPITNDSTTRTRLVEELAAKEIVMPKLYDWLVADLNRHDLTISAAIKNPAFRFFQPATPSKLAAQVL